MSMHRSRPEVIVEVGAEGGSIAILGNRTDDGWLFSATSDESAMAGVFDEKDLSHPPHRHSRQQVRTFREALTMLDEYPWPALYPVRVHPAFREQVWEAFSERDRWSRGEYEGARNGWAERCRPRELRLDFERINIPSTSVTLRPEGFDTFQSLLDHVYLTYLRDIVPAGTYGVSWVLTHGRNEPLKKAGESDARKLAEVGIEPGDVLTLTRM